MELEKKKDGDLYFSFPSIYMLSFSVMCNNINALVLGGGSGDATTFLEFETLTP